MTQPTTTTIDAGVAAVQANQRGLGLGWDLRPGAVVEATTASSMRVLIDGDAVPIGGVVSLDGLHAIGARVMVLATPEGGLYAVGMYGGNVPRQLTNFATANANANLSLGAGATLVPGTQISLTVTAEATYEAHGIFDFDETSAGTTVCIGHLYIDAAEHPDIKRALFEVTTVNFRATVAQFWTGVLTAGAHTFELRGSRSAASGTQVANALHTSLLVKTYE